MRDIYWPLSPYEILEDDTYVITRVPFQPMLDEDEIEKMDLLRPHVPSWDLCNEINTQ